MEVAPEKVGLSKLKRQEKRWVTQVEACCSSKTLAESVAESIAESVAQSLYVLKYPMFSMALQ
jgi:hypothetical protein